MPFFSATLIYEQYNYALLIFIVASITDLLDGLIARITQQITYFGSILDPVADKFFLITSFILMSMYGLIPTWLTIVVLSKDLIVVTGCIILYLATDNLKIEPTFLGKTASAVQFILIGAVLMSHNIDYGYNAISFFYVPVAVLTSLAGIHYVYRGLKIANPE